MSDQNKFIAAIVAGLGFMFIMDYLFPKPVAPLLQSDQHISSAPNPGSSYPITPTPKPLVVSQKIGIQTDVTSGFIDMATGSVYQLNLTQYKEDIKSDSSDVNVLTPDSEKSYVARFNYVVAGEQDTTQWVADSYQLTSQAPVRLSKTTDTGLACERVFTVHDKYLIKVQDTVVNTSSQPLAVRIQPSIERVGTPKTEGYYVLHEGGVGIIDHKLVELGYSKFSSHTQIAYKGSSGWIGFTDKYWIASLVPDASHPVQLKFFSQGDNMYTAAAAYEEVILNKGEKVTYGTFLYVGPKVLKILDDYENRYGFEKFDLAVDFGWFYFMTKPLFYCLDTLNSFFHSMGIAIMVMTIVFKLLMLPLSLKSHRSMNRMKKLAPTIDMLKTRYGSDKVKLNQEIMALYRKENVNPASGCLPMLLQAPVFFCLYKVFFVTIEMRHAPFMGWILDLSAPDPTSLFNLFGLIPWTPPGFLMIGLWPIVMGLTMVIQQKTGPQPADPQQAKAMMIMPFMFTFMFASFPVGLVLYWTWSNVLSILQQQAFNFYLKN